MKKIGMMICVLLGSTMLHGAAASTEPWAKEDAAKQLYWEDIQGLMRQYGEKEVPAGANIWNSWSQVDWDARENIIGQEGVIWEASEELGTFLVEYMHDYTTVSRQGRKELIGVMELLVPTLFGHGTPLEQEVVQQALESIKNSAPKSYPLLKAKFDERFGKKPEQKPAPVPELERKELSEEEQLAQALDISAAEAAAKAAEEAGDPDLAKALAESLALKQWDVPKDEKYNGDTTIHYLDVLEQRSADCGFHAAKNAYYMWQWAQGKTDKNEAHKSMKSQDPKIFNIQMLRKCITSHTNIDDSEVVTLMRKYGIPRAEFSMIANVVAGKRNLIRDPQPQYNIAIDEWLGKAVEKLREPADALHVFILADADPQLKLEGSKETLVTKPGHWIAVVVHKKDGKRDVYVANSLHDRSAHDDRTMVKALLEILDRANPQALTKAAGKAASASAGPGGVAAAAAR